MQRNQSLLKGKEGQKKKDICQYNIIRDYVDSLTKSPYVRREGQNLMHLITLVRNWERINGIGL